MSEQPKFTPGPWSASHRAKQSGMYSTQVYDVAGKTIADLAWYPVDLGAGAVGTSRDANARLIAAAPDLYEALVEFLKTGWEPNTLTGGPKRMAAEAKAQAALRKVIGEQP